MYPGLEFFKYFLFIEIHRQKRNDREMGLLCEKPTHSPLGAGAASTGMRPYVISACLAVERPSNTHFNFSRFR